jgi:ferrous iron transport protein B
VSRHETTETIAFSGVNPATGHRKSALVAIAGNPNAGKTTLFNVLTGIRAKTANFPGTTVEIKRGRLSSAHEDITLLDLPGMYSLDPSTPDEAVARTMLTGPEKPDIILTVLDATNLERNLLFASQLLDLDIPMIIAITAMDVADRRGVHVDIDGLRAELGCPVVAVSGRTGDGVPELRNVLLTTLAGRKEHVWSPCDLCRGCPISTRHKWSRDLCGRCVRAPLTPSAQHTEELDRWLTHPVYGLLAFLAVMIGIFFLIFKTAEWPMTWIEMSFETAAKGLDAVLADHLFKDMLINGVLAGVGGILVFLPQICLLFLALVILEDTGYLARAALVMDRWMKRIGLPGKAFVPMLTAHACAIPAIMATRVLEHPRDRLLTILVAPLLSCAARLPVYVMIVGLLVPDSPGKAALLLSGAYFVGIGAALGAAWVFRHTILPGKHQPLIIELPDYRCPSLRTALLFTLDRAVIFLKQAGTLILVFSMIMWFLASFPQTDPGEAVADGEHTITTELENSYAGRLGRIIEPVIRPLGFDWQIGIGLISSFAAREVLVSTMAIIYGMEGEGEESESFLDTLRQSRRRDGSPVFGIATCMSLLVFYILAAQCIPTQIITRRETGQWRWAFLQLGYMNALAYVAALLTYQILRFSGL